MSNYGYDSAGRLSSLQHVGYGNSVTGQPDTSSIAGYTFAWNVADQLTSINSVRDGLTNYSYDATSQLTGADYASQTDETFTYDANGNRTSVARVSDAGTSSFSSTITAHNRILNDGTSTYTYDAEGNRTSKTDIATGSKVEYQWNHANLLTAVIYKTSNNVVTKSVAYQYDALGRRIGKSVDDNGNGTVDRHESYIYDGAGLLATGERQGVSPPSASSAIHISGPNGSLGQHGWTDQMVLSFVDADGDGSGTAQLSGRYLYGPAVDEIFAVENGTGDVLWALTDQLGTPRDWAQRTTVGNTVIAQHMRYTAFGTIDSITDGAGNPLTSGAWPLASFTGQLNDPDAGLIYYRARWYDPQLGKFISDDPMGFEAGDANVSRYVGNRCLDSLDIT